MARTRRNASDKPETHEPEAHETEAVEAQNDTISQEGAEVDEAPETHKETEVTVETPEAPAAEAQEQAAPAEAQEQAAQAETPAAESAEPTPEELLTAFTEAIEGAYNESDPTTGETPLVRKQAVIDAYRALPNTARKNDAKVWVTDQLRSTMMENPPNIRRARCLADLNQLLNEAAARKAAAAPAKPQKSPTELFVEQVTILELAKQFVTATGDIDEDWHDKHSALLGEVQPEVAAYREWFFGNKETRGEEPDASDLIKAAVAAGQGKGTGSRRSSGTRRASSGGSTAGGPRRDVGKHIAEFLESVEPGHEAAVAEIVNFESSEYNSDNGSKVSAGAVAARLWPTGGRESSVTGWEDASDGGKRKIRKV